VPRNGEGNPPAPLTATSSAVVHAGPGKVPTVVPGLSGHSWVSVLVVPDGQPVVVNRSTGPPLL